jgi:hypothetical protein
MGRAVRRGSARIFFLTVAVCLALAATAAASQARPLDSGAASPADLLAEITNPVPEVTGLSPAQATVGDLDFGITVIGSGFVQGATVLWNGQNRDTGFISSTMLTASVRAADVAAAGTAFVSVSNPAPGGGQSPTARVFTINNPAPVLAAIDPASVWAGDEAFTLVVSGADFTTTSVVQVAGIDVATTYVSPERLEVLVPAAAVAHAAHLSVRVFTPVPGGGLSSPVFLVVEDDAVPPVTTVEGLDGLWHRTAVTFDLVATDVGRGVEKTFYRIGTTVQYSIGTRVRVPAPKDHSNDGIHVVQFFSIDGVLNWEAPPKEVQVAIDTRPPTTSIAAATVKKGGSLTPKYLVSDALSPRARDALLQIITVSGKVVHRHVLGRPSTRAWHTVSGCTVDLPRGTYKMRVLAHDLAGNAQSSTKSGVLTVK